MCMRMCMFSNDSKFTSVFPFYLALRCNLWKCKTYRTAQLTKMRRYWHGSVNCLKKEKKISSHKGSWEQDTDVKKTTFSFVYTMCDLVQISLPTWLSERSYHEEYTGSLIISKVNNHWLFKTLVEEDVNPHAGKPNKSNRLAEKITRMVSGKYSIQGHEYSKWYI